MEIYYSEIATDLTRKLAEIVYREQASGKQIYYIVPSSMSFDKEHQLLSLINDGSEAALMNLVVTRFKRLPAYLVNPTREFDEETVVLTRVGKAMLLRRTLQGFADTEIPLYARMSDNEGFIDRLVDLDEELTNGNMSYLDLPADDKNQQIGRILSAYHAQLDILQGQVDPIDQLVSDIKSGVFDDVLRDTVIVIDGYTRFSAQEEAILDALVAKVDQVYLATYGSQEDWGKLDLSLYKQGMRLMRSFQERYQATLTYVPRERIAPAFDQLSDLLAVEADFTRSDEVRFDDSLADHLQIWHAENSDAEIEQAAIQIKQYIARGHRYRNVSVVLADPDHYEIPIRQIFDRYDIPYFYGIESSMANHSLVLALETLLAMASYGLRGQDVVTFLKTGLYTVDPQILDGIEEFEYCVNAYPKNSKHGFTRSFTTNLQEWQLTDYLAQGELVRQALLDEDSVLVNFIRNNRKRLGKNWVQTFQDFLVASGMFDEMNQRAVSSEQKGNHVLADQYRQVWDALMASLSEYLTVFEHESMNLKTFLSILVSGLQHAAYRQVPANVDVVKIQDYELMTPLMNDLVIGLGFTQTNFPRQKKDDGLLSDSERQLMNDQQTDDVKKLALIGQDNFDTLGFTNLSMLNAATDKLILSAPQIFDNGQVALPELFTLITKAKFTDDREVGSEVLKPIYGPRLEDGLNRIGNYRGLVTSLSRLEQEMSSNRQEVVNQFWMAMFRIAIDKDPEVSEALLGLDDAITAVDLSQESVASIVPEDLRASVTTLESFYKCQYQYFLKNTLKLREPLSLDLDSRQVGSFFHRVYELVGKENPSSDNFDQVLGQVIPIAQAEFQNQFDVDNTSTYVWSTLADTVAQGATMLRRSLMQDKLLIKDEEMSFGRQNEGYKIGQIELRGQIDRVDQLFDEGIGAVDYKSSNKNFDISDAYDGLSLQLLTYLGYLKQRFPQESLWGAMYLHIKNKPIALNSLSSLEELPAMLSSSSHYKGLMTDDYKPRVQEWDMFTFTGKDATTVLSSNQLDGLIDHNESLITDAVKTIKSGHVTINPAGTEDTSGKRSVSACTWCQFKAICRFDSKQHLDAARMTHQKKKKEILEEMTRTEINAEQGGDGDE